MQTGSVTLRPSVPAGMGRGSSTNSKPLTMRKRIGSIVYEVEIHFNSDARETINDKKLRLIRRDLEAAS